MSGSCRPSIHELSGTKVLRDVTKVDPNSLAPVDALFAGFPCQPFARCGAQMGIADYKQRGVIVFYILDIVAQMTPWPHLLCLENVPGLLQHMDLLLEIVRLMRVLGYVVKVWMLSNLHSGIPQGRTRIWIIGLRSDCMTEEPTVPKPRRFLPSLTDGFLDLTAKVQQKELTERMDTLLAPIEKALLRSSEIDLGKHAVLVDIHASAKFSSWSVDRCPTLTRSRGMQGGFYVHQRQSMMMMDEMANLMGIPSDVLERMKNSELSEATICGAIGNAQSINVLERVLGDLWNVSMCYCVCALVLACLCA